MEKRSICTSTRLTCSQYFEHTPGEKLNSVQRLLCGGLAGITSVTFTYPLDIVRTRLSIQSASFKELGNKAGKKLPGMFELMATMYRTEGGWKALYSGIIPTVAGVAPYVSSLISARAYLTSLCSRCTGRSQFHDLRGHEDIFHT